MSVIGSTIYLQAPLPQLAIGRPLWISAWVRGTTATAGIMRLTGVGVQSCLGLYSTGGNLGLYDRNDSNGGGTLNPATPLNGSSAYTGSWFHFFGQATGSGAGSARLLYTNGVQTANGASAIVGAQTFNQIQIGCSVSAITWFGTVAVAEVAAGSGLLSAAQIQALAGGASPIRVCGPQLIAYYPLRGDRASAGPAAPGLAFSGTGGYLKWADHPPVEQPPRRTIFTQPWVSISGTANIINDGNVVLIGAGAVNGTSSLVCVGTDIKTGSGLLTGLAAGTLNVIGNVAGSGGIAGAVNVAGVATGVLHGNASKLGSAAIQVAGLEVLSGNGKITGTANIIKDGNVVLIGAGAVNGTSSLVCVGTDIKTGSGLLTGLAAGTLNVAGNVAGSGGITGPANINVTVQSSPTGIGQQSGSSSLTSNAVGTRHGLGTVTATASILDTAIGLKRGSGTVVGVAVLTSTATALLNALLATFGAVAVSIAANARLAILAQENFAASVVENNPANLAAILGQEKFVAASHLTGLGLQIKINLVEQFSAAHAINNPPVVAQLRLSEVFSSLIAVEGALQYTAIIENLGGMFGTIAVRQNINQVLALAEQVFEVDLDLTQTTNFSGSINNLQTFAVQVQAISSNELHLVLTALDETTLEEITLTADIAVVNLNSGMPENDTASLKPYHEDEVMLRLDR